MSGILRLESLTKGNTLRQGDLTLLKYRLFDADGDKLDISGKSATVRLMKNDFTFIAYEKEGLTVAPDDTISFSVNKVLPGGLYHLEVIVDNQYIFPSRDDEGKFNIDKSSLGADVTIVEATGVEAVARKATGMMKQDEEFIDGMIENVISDTNVGNIEEYYNQFNEATTEFQSLKTQTINSVTKSDKAIADSASAKSIAQGIDAKATNALNLSESADTLSKSVQEQFNQVVIDGDSSVESAQARVDARGVTKPTLKQRLDDDYTEITTQLEQTTTKLRGMEVTPFEFGAVGDGVEDDRQALTDAFNYAKENAVTVNLGTGNVYLVESKVENNIFTVDKRLHIKGASTIKIGAIGDYERIFQLHGKPDGSIFEDFTLDVNTRGNPLTVDSGHVVGSRRCDFYGANYGIAGDYAKELTFRNMKIVDTLGKWQFYLRADDVLIDRVTVEYSDLHSPDYDRTCLYMLGNRWVVQNSTFVGSPQALTLFETHGANQYILNNVSSDFNASVFIVNDFETNMDNLGDVVVDGNTFKNRLGIRIWCELDDVDFDNIRITKNTIQISDDNECILHYPKIGNNVHVKNLIIEGNVLVKDVGLTSHFISFGTALQTGSLVYENVVIKNNVAYGDCTNLVRLSIEPNPPLIIKNLEISDNTFTIPQLHGTALVFMVDDGYGYKQVRVRGNIFNIEKLMLDDFYTYAMYAPSRTEVFGNVTIENNVYNHPKPVGAWLFGTNDCRKLVVATEKFLVDTNSMLTYIRHGIIEDIYGNKTTYLDGVKQTIPA